MYSEMIRFSECATRFRKDRPLHGKLPTTPLVFKAEVSLRPSVASRPRVPPRCSAERASRRKYQKRCESSFEYISINLLLFSPPRSLCRGASSWIRSEVESFVHLGVRRNAAATCSNGEKAGLRSSSRCLPSLDGRCKA